MQINVGDSHSIEKNIVKYVSFNQNKSCIICGTENGFFICTLDPVKLKINRQMENASINIAEMLFTSNIIAFVGDGKYNMNGTLLDPQKLHIWDDNQNCFVGYLQYEAKITSIKMRRDCMLVTTAFGPVYLHDIVDLKILYQSLPTLDSYSVSDLSILTKDAIFAHMIEDGTYIAIYKCPNMKITSKINLDNFVPSKIRFNDEATLLAIASSDGKNVRVYETENGNLIKEFRRGSTQANICCISFNKTSTLLCVGSDKGSIHVFALKEIQSGPINIRSSLYVLSNYLPKYFSSEWSFVRLYTSEQRMDIAFSSEDDIYIAGWSGMFYMYKIIFDKEKNMYECQCKYSIMYTEMLKK